MGNGRKLQAASIENFVMRGSTTGLPTHVEEAKSICRYLDKMIYRVFFYWPLPKLLEYETRPPQCKFD